MIETIFCAIDDFCKHFEKELGKHALTKGRGIRLRESGMSLSEVMTIMIMSKRSGYKNFKTFYFEEKDVLKDLFPQLVSYSRFVELEKMATLPLIGFFYMCCRGECTGKSYADSTRLSACHCLRRYSCKTLCNVASSGKTSTGWFFGMKLHIVINQSADLLDLVITSGNVADNNHDLIRRLCREIYGKIFGDKGYIMAEDFLKELAERKIQFVTKKRKNMKKETMNPEDMKDLKHRGLIESALGLLKSKYDLENTRYRSIHGFINNILTALIAYSLQKIKPSIKGKSKTNPGSLDQFSSCLLFA